MSSIVLSPGATGAAAFTIEAPSTATSRVITLPDATDTLVGKATTDTLTNKSIVATQLTGTVAAARMPAGSVLQVVQGSTTTMGTSTNNSTWVSTSLSASITPISSASKILVLGQHGSVRVTSGAANGVSIRILRNSTSIAQPASELLYNTVGIDVIAPFQYLDSPATTSSTTYSTEFKLLASSSSTAQINANAAPAYITLMEIAA